MNRQQRRHSERMTQKDRRSANKLRAIEERTVALEERQKPARAIKRRTTAEELKAHIHPRHLR